MSSTDLLSVSQAAEKLGISRWRINQLINSGRLPAQKVGRAYVVKESDLKLIEDRKPGRPSKEKNKR
jgi:excisionase family DNA binding protein